MFLSGRAKTEAPPILNRVSARPVRLSLASGALFTGHFLEVRKNCLSACVYADRQHLSDHVTDAVCMYSSQPIGLRLAKNPDRETERER